MQTFSFHIGLNVRNYGDIDIAAETAEDAVAKLTPGFVSENLDRSGTDWDNISSLTIIDALDESGTSLDDWSQYDIPDANQPMFPTRNLTLWTVATSIPEPGEKPCVPDVFATEEEAVAHLERELQLEWETNGPGESPYPGNWQVANQQIMDTHSDGSWGSYILSRHDVDVVQDAVTKFVHDMARFTTPEDEFAANPQHFADVEELISEMDDERLCGEYATFMDMVREARRVIGGTSDHAQPAPKIDEALFAEMASLIRELTGLDADQDGDVIMFADEGDHAEGTPGRNQIFDRIQALAERLDA